jgi:hypothetical protein
MDSSILNLKDLEVLTGKTFKTLKKRLENLDPVKVTPKGNFYDARHALPLLYEAKQNGDLDLSSERAKLANAQTEKTIVETEKLKERYVPVEEVERQWSAVILNARSKLLLLPKKMAFDLKGITDVEVIEERLETYIYDALTDLSQGK